jgi:hypothetical protein
VHFFVVRKEGEMSTGYDLFISYRRADAGGHAGRLYDRLRHWFDDGVMFYDLDAIDMGDVFPENIETAINTALTVLVVIGPDWLAEINQRVDRPGIDFVRREIELALARSGHDNPPKIVPVLVGGATMPDQNQFHPSLQPSLAPLCRLDAHTFQGKQADWDQQFVRLRERLAQVPGMPEPRFRAPAGVERPFHITGDSLSLYFQDPNNLLGRLREQLADSQRATLCGMGGLGKTQMALKYSLEYRDAYAGVWWFRAESDTTLQLDALAACQKVGAPSDPGETPSSALNRWLERQKDTWLLVYDNAQDAAALRPHLPRSGSHHLLITSRSLDWEGLAPSLELDIWTPEQSADFLASRLPGKDRTELMELGRDLGGLPLALEQAAAYMGATRSTVSKYRSLLNGIQTEGQILNKGQAATGYQRTVAGTLTLAFDQLSDAAQQLLRLCAFAAPEPFPERFFAEAGEDLPSVLANAAQQPLQWDEVIAELLLYGLVKRQELPALDGNPDTDPQEVEQAISLHRLTQRAIRTCCSTPADDCRILLHVLRVCCPSDSELPHHWPRYAMLAPHITQLDRYVSAGWLDNRLFTWLLSELGSYLRNGPALFKESAQWLQRAIDIDRQDLGEEHPDTLRDMNDLASTLFVQGDLGGAKALQEKTLEGYTRIFGEEHPNTLCAINNLAGTLSDQGDLGGARMLQEKVLEGYTHIFGEEHLCTLSAINNLASTLFLQGDLNSARTLQEKVLKVSTRILGEEHLDTLTTMNNLAGTLGDQGDLGGARRLQEHVLEVCTNVFGKEHLNTLIAMNNLAETLRQQDDISGARRLQEHVLEVCTSVLGEEHLNTLTAMNNLAGTLRQQNDISGARRLLEHVLEVCTNVFGEEHLNTLTAMNNLAETLWQQDDINGALTLEEHVLEVCASVLGEGHPYTSRSAWNLYLTLKGLNQIDTARFLLHNHLLWLLDREPQTLGADQRQIREDLAQALSQKNSEEADR